MGSARLDKRGYGLLLVGAGVVLMVSMALGLRLGAVSIPTSEVLHILGQGPGQDTVAAQIVWQLRLPRILLGVFVGAGLAASGAALQAVMRSPLADPYILGVSSGASVGAALVVVTGLFTGVLGGLAMTAAAFATGTLSVLAVYGAARVSGHVPSIRLLLAGVAWSAFAGAVTGFVLLIAPEAAQVRGVIFWLMGGLGGADWYAVGFCGVVTALGVAALIITGRWQNLLLLGDEPALALGLDVTRARGWLISVAALITSTAVAFSGAIGFVGLVVPHAVRPFTGPDHRRLVPACAMLGGALLVGLDCVARVVLAPREVPVGLLSGLLGAPFFMVLLRRYGGHVER